MRGPICAGQKATAVDQMALGCEAPKISARSFSVAEGALAVNEEIAQTVASGFLLPICNCC